MNPVSRLKLMCFPGEQVEDNGGGAEGLFRLEDGNGRAESHFLHLHPSCLINPREEPGDTDTESHRMN